MYFPPISMIEKIILKATILGIYSFDRQIKGLFRYILVIKVEYNKKNRDEPEEI